MSTIDKINKDMSVDEIIAILNKKFKKEVLMKASDLKQEKVSSGIPILDYIIGGGIPRGRLIQLFGQFNTGKTMIALKTIVEAQKRGELCAFIDTEKAFDTDWAKKLGVDVKKLYISQPTYGEEALDIIEGLTVSNEFSIIALDSIASLVPLAELETKMEQQHMGLSARMMNKALRKLIAGNKDTILFFINQVREKIGILYGSPYTRTGGRGLDFISTILMRIKRSDWIKNQKGQKIGHFVTIIIEKNKVAPPYQTCTFPFYYDGTMPLGHQYAQVAIDLDLIVKKGSWYALGDQKFQGLTELNEIVLEDKKLIKKLDEAIKIGIKYRKI